MSALSDVRHALADFIAEALPDVVVEPFLPDTVATPAVIVAGIELEAVTFDQQRKVQVDLYCVVSRSHVDQVSVLDDLVIGVWDAITADPSIGDGASSVVPLSVGAYRDLPLDAGYYAATVVVEVLI